MFDSGLPLLGICYGQQTLHQQLGGKVVTSNQKEFGRAFIEMLALDNFLDRHFRNKPVDRGFEELKRQ